MTHENTTPATEILESADTCYACQRPFAQVRRLVDRSELASYLSLADEQIQWLINTRQITKLRVAGLERFDLRQVDDFVISYRNTAERRADAAR